MTDTFDQTTIVARRAIPVCGHCSSTICNDVQRIVSVITPNGFDVRVLTKEDFNRLQESVDGIAKQFQEQRQEQIVGALRSERMEAWIIKAAGKIGVEYKP